MSELKSKNIQFFANELRNADRDIELTKRLCELSLATLSMYNGSGDKYELQIWKGLKKPLMDFLLTHYKESKQKIYEQIEKEL